MSWNCSRLLPKCGRNASVLFPRRKREIIGASKGKCVSTSVPRLAQLATRPDIDVASYGNGVSTRLPCPPCPVGRLGRCVPGRGDLYRINDLIKPAQPWQSQTALGHKSGMETKDLSLVGRSDAAYGDKTKEGKCRQGYLIACRARVTRCIGRPVSPVSP